MCKGKVKEQDAATSCSVGRAIYFFLVGFAWDRALPATLFDAVPKRLSLRILEAVVATALLVCFVFRDAIVSPPFTSL